MTTSRGSRDLAGIVQVTIPVGDLARSAAWYRDLLDLDYVREFGDDDRVTGCALADWAARPDERRDVVRALVACR